jgi:hypothetical protein
MKKGMQGVHALDWSKPFAMLLPMADNVPDQEFWDAADRFIAVANEHCEHVTADKVSSAFQYAAARFNCFTAATARDSREQLEGEREEIIRDLLGQYEWILRENLEDCVANFEAYTGIAPTDPS